MLTNTKTNEDTTHILRNLRVTREQIYEIARRCCTVIAPRAPSVDPINQAIHDAKRAAERMALAERGLTVHGTPFKTKHRPELKGLSGTAYTRAYKRIQRAEKEAAV